MDSAGISEPLSTGLPPLGEVRSAAVRQLLPSQVDPVTPLDLYPFDARHRDDGRPWVMMNMVASADGAIAIDGRSGGLGGDGDREVFRAIRASCDWIVVAAGTVRAERYGIPRTTAEIATVRRRAGRMPAPRLAVVSGTLDLDPGLPLFADRRPHEEPPLLITGPSPPPERVAALDDHSAHDVRSGAHPTREAGSFQNPRRELDASRVSASVANLRTRAFGKDRRGESRRAMSYASSSGTFTPGSQLLLPMPITCTALGVTTAAAALSPSTSPPWAEYTDAAAETASKALGTLNSVAE